MVTMNGQDATAVMPPQVTAAHLEHQLDDDDDNMSEGSGAQYEDAQDLMSAAMQDEVTAQLAAAGPVGVAAAAAIASAKKRKRPHTFETNPSIRKRQQTRLLRKLRQTIDEFTIRVGMQAVVLVAIPGKPQNSYKVFGAKPLEDVVRNLRPTIMTDLESALAQHTPAPAPEDPSLHELPPLVIDGIPTPVEKMTQAQLRAFIPLMLKYSTGRGKPGWGKESTRPPWWPIDLPWANVRMDARTEDEKQQVSWTHALRQIVINCYKYHAREDLLPVFSGDPEELLDIKPQVQVKLPKTSPCPAPTPIVTTTSTNSTGSTSIVATQNQSQAILSQALPFGLVGGQYQSVLQTITNPDGSMSVIQVDPTNSIITLADGTTAQVQGVATLQHNPDGGAPTVQHVQTIAEVAAARHDVPTENPVMDLNTVSQAALTNEGQIILTGEDGHTYPVTVSGMIHVPVTQNLYHSVVTTQLQAQQGADGTLQRPVVELLSEESMEYDYAYDSDASSPVVPLSPDAVQRLDISFDNLDEIKKEHEHNIALIDLDKIKNDGSDIELIELGNSDDEIDDDFFQVIAPMVLPKIEPGTENEPHHITTIPLSVLTGDPNQNQLVALNANGQVVHNDKIYQICEYTKPDSHEKVIMMAEVNNTPQPQPLAIENGITHQIQQSQAPLQNVQSQDAQVITITQNANVQGASQGIIAKDNSNKENS